jgi:hypothetical protein
MTRSSYVKDNPARAGRTARIRRNETKIVILPALSQKVFSFEGMLIQIYPFTTKSHSPTYFGKVMNANYIICLNIIKKTKEKGISLVE